MCKLKFLLLNLIIVATFGCSNAQLRSIKGNGNVVKETRTVSNFTGVKVSNGIDLYITQDGNEKLELEMDENILKVIKTEVENGILKIYSTRNIRNPKSLKAYLSCKVLNSIVGSSGADIFGKTEIQSDDLYVSLSSAASLKSQLHSNSIKLSLSSGSDAKVTYNGKKAIIDASSGSNLNLTSNGLDMASCDMSSAADINLSGSSKKLIINASSGADLDATDFIAVDVNADISSGSDVDISIVGKLTVDASSGADLTYQGKPTSYNVNCSSGGSVSKK